MKYVQFFFTLIFFSSFTVQSQTEKKVLFIGNSYTSSNYLPSLVHNMALSTGENMIYDSIAPGGFRLINHASNQETQVKINSNNWDYVILQAQSQETSLSLQQMESELFPYAESLCDNIRENYECSQPLFYMTWGRQNGDANNCAVLPWVCTYEGMDDSIAATYSFMSENNNAELAPVGAVWRYIRTNFPDVNLYSSDGSHPSNDGSYAAACAIYTMIYKKDPTLILWNSNLTEENAEVIKSATKIVVYDSINNWNFTINPAIANFSETINANEVLFTNLTQNFDSLHWDFGDGNTSDEINPIHSYTFTGNYNVTLTVSKCGKIDSMTKALNINYLGSNTVDSDKLSIFPNPTSKNVTINLDKSYANIRIALYDLTGRLVLQSDSKNAHSLDLNLSNLNCGKYFVTIFLDDEFYFTKISKV